MLPFEDLCCSVMVGGAKVVVHLRDCKFIIWFAGASWDLTRSTT